jgi:hypothetical protein
MTLTLESLCAAAGITTRPVGLYDAPDPEPFSPWVPLKGCVFDHFTDWQRGETLHVDGTGRGCPGCSYWLSGIGRFPSREAMVAFLTDKEGLKARPDLTGAWLDAHPVGLPAHGHILIGPVRPALARYLKTVTFFVTPDQLSVLVTGATYHAHPRDPAPVLALFGSGCGQMLNLFPGLDGAQAILGATDIAMRPYLPPDVLTFTVTVPMLERLLSLDDGHSFLEKPFLQKLRTARQAVP